MKQPPTLVQFANLLHEYERMHGPITIDLGIGFVVCLVGTLQLALRYPGNRGPTFQQIRGFLDDLFCRIGERSPDLADFLRLGDDPAHDQPAGSADRYPAGGRRSPRRLHRRGLCRGGIQRGGSNDTSRQKPRSATSAWPPVQVGLQGAWQDVLLARLVRRAKQRRRSQIGSCQNVRIRPSIRPQRLPVWSFTPSGGRQRASPSLRTQRGKTDRPNLTCQPEPAARCGGLFASRNQFNRASSCSGENNDPVQGA